MTNPFDGWVWPIASFYQDDHLRHPVVSSAYGPRDRNTYSCGIHLGADIMFPWLPGDPIKGPLASTAVSKIRGRWGYYMPPQHCARAVGPGKVIRAQKNSRGHDVVIDHGNTVLTWYQHLQAPLSVSRGDTVKAGQVLGLVGWDTKDQQLNNDREQLHHLHFEWWFKNPSYPAATPCHDKGKRMGLGFRAIALDPASYLHKLTHTVP